MFGNKRKRHLLRACAGVTVLFVGLSACGSSGKTSSPTTKSGASPTSGTSGGSGTSATPYVIGQVGTFSGSYASSNVGAKYGLDAWVKYTNAHGGVDGHPVKLISMDDQLNAALALTDVKQLVQQDHVMAIVGISSIVEDGITSYIASGSTPLIGDDLAKQIMGVDKNFFPEGTTNQNLYYWGVPKVAALEGKTNFGAIYCAESVACQQIAAGQKQQAGSAGVKFGFVRSSSASATSYTPQCLAAKASGEDAIALILPESESVNVASSCTQQGYQPLYLEGSDGFTASESSAPVTVAGPLPDFPWFDSNTPAEQAFQAAMHMYEPAAFSASTNGYGEGAASAWASGAIFAAAASHLSSGQTSGADLTNQLVALPKNDTFGGLTPPITYGPASSPQPGVNCMFAIELKDHKYSALQNGKELCKT